MTKEIDRILITGAAGAVGQVLRERLRGRYPVVRLSDVAPLAVARDGEELAPCDLTNADAVAQICADVDAIIHLGGNAHEAAWPEIIAPNILGAINLWEGARAAGVDRVLYASSNHVTGLYPRSRTIDAEAPARPDSRYGVSKAFGEDLACLYAFKHGVRAFCMRLGNCRPQPMDRRALSTWLSADDLDRLVTVGLTAEYHFEIVYGVSRNTRSWWDNSSAYRLGYDPQDDAEVYASRVAHIESDDELAKDYQGGPFVAREFDGNPGGLQDQLES